MKHLNITGDEFLVDKLESVIELYSTDCVFLSGSVIEGNKNKFSKGMGNKKSDLDVFVIRDDNLFQNTDYTYFNEFKKTNFFKLEKVKLDVEYYKKSFFEDIINKINNSLIDDNIRIDNIIKVDCSIEELNSIVNRFFYSMCIKNDELFKLYYNNLDFKKFSKIYKGKLFNILDNLTEDLYGNLEENQIITALFCAREIFKIYAKIVIFNFGEFVDRDKWVFLKFFNLVNFYNLDVDKVIFKKLFISDLNDNIKIKTTIVESLNYIEQRLEEIMLEDIVL